MFYLLYISSAYFLSTMNVQFADTSRYKLFTYQTNKITYTPISFRQIRKHGEKQMAYFLC